MQKYVKRLEDLDDLTCIEFLHLRLCIVPSPTSRTGEDLDSSSTRTNRAADATYQIEELCLLKRGSTILEKKMTGRHP